MGSTGLMHVVDNFYQTVFPFQLYMAWQVLLFRYFALLIVGSFGFHLRTTGIWLDFICLMYSHDTQ